MTSRWPNAPACPKCTALMRPLITVYRCPDCGHCAAMVGLGRVPVNATLPKIVEDVPPEVPATMVQAKRATYGLVIPARRQDRLLQAPAAPEADPAPPEERPVDNHRVDEA